MAIQIGVAQGEVSGLNASAPWAQGQKQRAIEEDLLGLNSSHPVPQPVLVRIPLVPFKPDDFGNELGNQPHVLQYMLDIYDSQGISSGLVGARPVHAGRG